MTKTQKILNWLTPDLDIYTVVVMAKRDLEDERYHDAIMRLAIDNDKLRSHNTELGEFVYNEFRNISSVRNLLDMLENQEEWSGSLLCENETLTIWYTPYIYNGHHGAEFFENVERKLYLGTTGWYGDWDSESIVIIKKIRDILKSYNALPQYPNEFVSLDYGWKQAKEIEDIQKKSNVNDDFANMALRIADSLREEYQLPKITTSADGGIAFQWDDGNKKLVIEIGVPYHEDVEWHYIERNVLDSFSRGYNIPHELLGNFKR
jgi:hypothetical protein